MARKKGTQLPKQASVIPYRFGESGLEFCLITTRRSSRWSFPKGWIGNAQAPHEAALEEALEEAGLIGSIVDGPLGQYTHKKQGQRLLVVVMLMDVTRVLDQWHEATQRQRRWVSLQEADALLDRPALRQMLLEAVKRLTAADSKHSA